MKLISLVNLSRFKDWLNIVFEEIGDVVEELTGRVSTVENGKQPNLVSGQNIKTLNNQSILGSGNIEFATATQGAKADTAYQKSSNGIPKSDLVSAVQTSLGKADSAVQPAAISDMATKTWVGQQGYLTEHQSLSEYRKAASQDTIDNAIKNRLSVIEAQESRWNAKQEALVSGTNIKTVNNQSIVGSGNISIVTDVSLAISALTSNPSSIALNSTAARTYQTCTLSSRTSVTLSGGNANAGYEHYILFYNSSSRDCVITKASGMLGPEEIKVPAGKRLELSWVYNGSNVVLTASEALQ